MTTDNQAHAAAAISHEGAAMAALLDRMREGCIQLDSSGRVTFINAAAERLAGLTRANLLGALLEEECPALVPSGAEAGLAAVRANRTSASYEVEIRGGAVRLECEAVPFDAGIALLLRPGVEPLSPADALLHSEERYRSLVEATSSVVWTTDACGNLVPPQPSWERYTGQTPDEYKDRGGFAAIHPEDRPSVLAAWSNALATRQPFDVEYRVKHAQTGDYRCCRSRGIPITNPTGDIREWVGTLTDIHEQKTAAARLAASEQRLGLALEAANMATWEWDLKTEEVRFSDRFAKVCRLGHPLDADTAARRAWVHPEDLEAVSEAEQGAIETGIPFAIEYRTVGAHGAVNWVAGWGVVLRDADGCPDRMLGVVMDITERKRAEQALHDTEERCRALADGLPQFVWVRRSDGHIDYANEHCSSYTGQTMAGRRSEEWLELVHPDDRARLVARVKALARDPYEEEFRLKRFDGRYRWHLARTTPIRYSNGGEGWLGTAIDIHDRKRAEAERSEAIASLSETKRFLFSLLDNAPAAIYACDESERYVLVNRTWELLAGVSRSDAVGRTLAEVWGEDTAQRLRTTSDLAWSHGSPARAEEYLMRSDGGHWLDTIRFPVRDDTGAIVSMAGISIDITERKRAEHERERLTAELDEERARLRSVIQYMPAGVILTDGCGSTVLCNDTAATYMTAMRAREQGDDPLMRAMLTGNPAEGELVAPEAGKRRARVLHVAATPIRSAAGEITAGIAVFSDITARKRAEDRVRESEERFRLLTQAIPQLVWTCRADGRFDFCSRQWFDYTGQTLRQALGNGWRAAIHPDDIEPTLELWRTAASRKSVFQTQHRIRSKSGQYRWHLARAFPLTGENGEIVKWFGTSTDVEDQKQAEEALRRGEQRYRFLANAMPQFVWTTDPAGAFQYANEFLLTFTGLAFEEVLSDGWYSRIHPDDRASFMARVERSLATGDDLEGECRVLRAADSTYRWILPHARRIAKEDGQFQWLGTAKDIHDRKQAAQEVSRLNQDLARRIRELETLLELTPAGIGIAYDRDCEYIRFNRAFIDWTGIGGDGVLVGTGKGGRPIPYRVFENGRELRVSELPIRVAAREGRAVESQVTILRKDGRKVDIWGFATPLLDEHGVPLGALGVFLDITERNSIEQALRRANADLEQFAYAASHDLQEPIRNVALYAQLLERTFKGQLGDEGDRMIATVVEGARRMHTLVQDLLSYTRAIDASDGTARCDGKAAFDDAMYNLSAAVGDSGAAVTCGELPVLAMSCTHLTQVFQNLIGNAIKYRSDRVPDVSVTARFDGHEWVIAVRDNGMGIEAEHKERIFGVFKRLHGREIPGTGVGLAICSRIVTHYGGRIWVESEPGEGSTFYFTAGACVS